MPDVLIQKTTFRLDPENGVSMIRWGYLKTKSGPKLFAFKISAIEATLAKQEGVDFLKRSDEIWSQFKNIDDISPALYEWQGSDFVEVEPNKQSWFKLNYSR